MLQTQRTTSSSSLKIFKIKEPVIFMKVLGKELGILLSGAVAFSDLLENRDYIPIQVL
jgi:hypothetical protein